MLASLRSQKRVDFFSNGGSACAPCHWVVLLPSMTPSHAWLLMYHLPGPATSFHVSDALNTPPWQWHAVTPPSPHKVLLMLIHQALTTLHLCPQTRNHCSLHQGPLSWHLGPGWCPTPVGVPSAPIFSPNPALSLSLHGALTRPGCVRCGHQEPVLPSTQ